VAPFRSAGSDEYAHLGRALESMLIDTLSVLPGVQVLDREHVNALIEEAMQGGSGPLGENAATRSGKLLAAGSPLTDWTQSPTHLRLKALLVDVDAGATIASARTETLATEFYNLVPGVAKGFASSLGQPLDTLPPDVREKIEQPHTTSIKAVLLLGEALDALDRKDVDAARKAGKALEKEDADFPLAKRKCAYIPLEWLALSSVVSAVEPMATATAGAAGGAASTVSEELSKEATEPSSYKKYMLLGALALLLIGGGVGGYVASQGGGSSGDPPNPASPPGGNNPPRLRGVVDRSVPAGGTAAIDMQCVDPDSTSTSIQNTKAGPNSSFDQTSGDTRSAHYRQPTNTNQVGQVFNVAFVCTDNGNPPASDTKTARISVFSPLTDATPTTDRPDDPSGATTQGGPTATVPPKETATAPTETPTRTPSATSKPSSSSSPRTSPSPTSPPPNRSPTR
jgi:hypothetical protein